MSLSLKFDTFIEDIVDTLANPFINGPCVRALAGLDYMTLILIRERYMQKYGWFISSRAFLHTFRNKCNKFNIKVINAVGSGKAYGEWLMQQSLDFEEVNTVIIASDKGNSVQSPGKSYMPVQTLNAFKAICRNITADCILFAWPTLDDPWAAEALKLSILVNTKYVIYIGEGYGGCCATDEFHELLSSLEEIPNNGVEFHCFPRMDDSCTFYRNQHYQDRADFIADYRNPAITEQIELSVKYFMIALAPKSVKKQIISIKKQIFENFGIRLSCKVVLAIMTKIKNNKV